MTGADDTYRWRLVAEFVEDYHWEPKPDRQGLLRAEPAPIGDERWDVFLAAPAEHLAARNEGGAGRVPLPGDLRRSAGARGRMTPYLDEAVTSERLAGGTHHAVWLARQADGVEVVVKATPGAPAGMFEAEAEGLSVLRESGAVAVPRVIDVGDAHLVLEALRPVAGLEDVGFWAEAGRSLARLHAIGNDRFGWHRDNWLGPTPQINTWSTDGYAFFAEYRVLHYLAQPAVPEWLDDAARAGVERICARLPQLVPPSRPALTHGDLWPGNMLATHAGEPALIDPAVSWNWPDADTSMMFCAGMPVPDAYFDAYHEIRPADPDWRDHLRILHLRELLCLIAQRNPLAERAARAVLDLVARYG